YPANSLRIYEEYQSRKSRTIWYHHRLCSDLHVDGCFTPLIFDPVQYAGHSYASLLQYTSRFWCHIRYHHRQNRLVTRIGSSGVRHSRSAISPSRLVSPGSTHCSWHWYGSTRGSF